MVIARVCAQRPASASRVPQAAVIVYKLRKVLEVRRLHEQHRSMDRVKRAIESKQQLRHPAVFIHYAALRTLGRFVSHEEARATGELTIVDTFDQLTAFTRSEATLFVPDSRSCSVLVFVWPQ